jgi:hypothetical protein
MQEGSMKKLTTLVAIGLIAGSAHAAPITENINFSLSGFVDVINTAPSPITLITGSFTVTYDPTLTYSSDTTDIVVHSLNGVTVDSPLGFTYGSDLMEFGGTQTGSNYVTNFTNDLVVSFNLTDPANPTFVPCSTSGYSCGNYTGSSAIDASGYSEAGTSSIWFYSAQKSVVTTVPEPATLSLMGLGLALTAFARRARKG